jgi:ribosome-associated translation inhibitor RaiA
MASSETMTAYVSKKPEKLTEKHDWIINADVILKRKTTFENERHHFHYKIQCQLMWFEQREMKFIRKDKN